MIIQAKSQLCRSYLSGFKILFAPTSVNDLNLYKEAWSEIWGRTFFGDNIYKNYDFFQK